MRCRRVMGPMVAVLFACGRIAGASTDELLEAAANGCTSTIEKLLRSGLSADVRDARFRTALMLAAFNGHEEAVTALLKAGAHVNWGTPDGDTALMAAAFRGHYGVARLLLSRGAEASQSTFDRTTAAGIARAKGHHDVAALLDFASGATTPKDLAFIERENSESWALTFRTWALGRSKDQVYEYLVERVELRVNPKHSQDRLIPIRRLELVASVRSGSDVRVVHRDGVPMTLQATSEGGPTVIERVLLRCPKPIHDQATFVGLAVHISETSLIPIARLK